LLAEGRYLRQWDGMSYYVYVAEGIDSPIVVSESEDGTRCFHVAGKVEASTIDRDVRTQRLLGHLPALAHEAPKKVLVVGCGSGMTAGCFLLHPSVEEIVLCEMEKCVIEASRQNFGDYNYGVLHDSMTRIVHDDARHFLATTRETFDVITTDPIHPWVKGAATLYTLEFFQLCKKHLSQDGVVTLWIPLYESSEETVKCELATFLQVFPEATIWSGQSSQIGYDLVVVGSAHGQPAAAESIVGRMYGNEMVRMSFDAVGLGTAVELLNSFTATGNDLREWLKDAQINRDSNLRLQYLAGTSPDDVLEQQIVRAMTAGKEGRK
jgi:spermidine synthase